jgi:hypothetical protein
MIATEDNDFERIAAAFVVEEEFERDPTWTKLVQCLTAQSPGRDAPELLAAPPIDVIRI